MSSPLTHFDREGKAHMVDVADKGETRRVARASGRIHMNADTLQLIAEGRANKQIAAELVISEATVRTHVSNILGKLALEDRTQAAIWALKHNLGPVD